MAMTYTEAAALERNTWFIERVRTATSVYANYLLNTGAADPQYAEKITVAQRLSSQSALVVSTLMFTLSGDPEVQAAGPCIPDATLQAIVEKTIKKFYPIPPLPPETPEVMHHRPARPFRQ